jgi:hypothetical protein
MKEAAFMAKHANGCTHENVELQLHSPETGEIFDRRPLSRQEIEASQVNQLPDREAMSLVNANVAAPINLAAALNVLSDNSTALAGAQQVAPIQQGI